MNVQLPDGTVIQDVPDGTTKAQLAQKLQANGKQVPQEWLQPVQQASQTQPAQSGYQPKTLMDYASNAVGEPLLHLATGAIAAPIAGWAGILSGGNGDVVNKVQNALTYQPRTQIGQQTADVVTKPFQWLAAGADKAGSATADLTGSPMAGAAVNTAVQALPALLLKGRGAKAKVGDEAVNQFKANENAKQYVNTGTGVHWDSLAQSTKDTLRQVGVDASNFDQLDPVAMQRQLQLASLPKPIENATRGQLTRDPIQLQREELLKSTDAGQPLREGAVQQNRTLIENLDVLKGKKQQPNLATGGKAIDQETTGASMQSAARAKLSAKQDQVSALYKQADATGELQGGAPVQPLTALMSDPINRMNMPYVQRWLKEVRPQAGAVSSKMTEVQALEAESRKGKYFESDNPTKEQLAQETAWEQRYKEAKARAASGQQTMVDSTEPIGQQATLAQLESLRQAAVAERMDGGTKGYYAGKVIAAIDQATEGSGGKAYKAARRARREQALEFQDQGAVEQLVSNDSRTDRSIALENTWKKTVLGGSLEDLQKVQKSLLTGGDTTTRTAGRIAWRDVKGQTIDYIRQEATRGITNQAGEANATYNGLKRALDKVGEKKLKLILGDKDAVTVQNIVKAAETLKTEPAGTGVRGSNTVNKILNILDKSLVTKIPGIGQVTEGVVRAGAKVAELGKGGREARAAQSSDLNNLAQKTSANALAQDVAKRYKSYNALALQQQGNR